jgi:hypothetical protein
MIKKMRVTKALKIEFEAYVALLGVIILNIFIFARLAAGNTGQLNSLLQQTENSLIVYIFFLLILFIVIIINQIQLIRPLFYLLFAALTTRIVIGLYSLIIDPKISDNGLAILTDAFLIWTASLLVFSLWYWMIDRGGPLKRAEEEKETRYDLLFPQYQSSIPGWEHWKPKFLDYVFFSFFTSTGFTPADTLPLTKRVKMLMMTEAAISLIIIGMVASRAISLIQ